MSRYQLAELGVKGAIFRRGRLLLLHRRDDLIVAPRLWDMPGGGVEVGDGLEDSLIREVQEETGFTVQVGRPIHAQIVHTRLGSGRELTVAVVYYECSTSATGAPRLDPQEHTEFAWVAWKELSKYRLSADQRVAIRKAFRHEARS